MILKSNAHTHTSFCDGLNTPEEIVLKAISLGFIAIGFTSHSNCADKGLVPEDFWLDEKRQEEYIKEVNRLKLKYKEKIAIYLSLEIDSLSVLPLPKLDYKLCSVHYVKGDDGIQYPVDLSPESFKEGIEKGFKNDVYYMIEKYYKAIDEMLEKFKPDICGHVDLIKIFNKGNVFFDENSDRYKNIVIPLIKKYASKVIFEINTNVVFKKRRTTPYPNIFILEEILKNNGKIMINSDSHTIESLNFYFEEALELCKKIGFKKISMLGLNNLEEVDLESENL